MDHQSGSWPSGTATELNGQDGEDGQGVRKDGSDGKVMERSCIHRYGKIFIASLKGYRNRGSVYKVQLKGSDGTNGTDGQDGEDGQDGTDGSDGKTAYQVWKVLHRNRSQFIASSKGQMVTNGD